MPAHRTCLQCLRSSFTTHSSQCPSNQWDRVEKMTYKRSLKILGTCMTCVQKLPPTPVWTSCETLDLACFHLFTCAATLNSIAFLVDNSAISIVSFQECVFVFHLLQWFEIKNGIYYQKTSPLKSLPLNFC